MAESFGARLRQQRERQLIPLSAIAEKTKIGLSLLEGLERDDVSHWPMGIFRRSFIRGYAQAVGLDPGAVVREFLEVHPEPEADATIMPTPADSASSGRRPPTRLRCLLAAAFPFLSRSRPPSLREPLAPSPEFAEATYRGWRLESAPEVAAATLEVSDASAQVVTPAAEVVAEPPDEASAPHVVSAPQPEPDLSGVAHLCTELSRALAIRDVAPLLGSAASLVDAVGMIVWVWDARAMALTPALSHGYSEAVLARLPRVRRDTDNATAAAFRLAETQVVAGSDQTSGALAVPMVTPAGCVGVLAVELRNGWEGRASVRALASILAAQLATVVGFAPLAEAVNT
jgi:hypothetical protein